jgi:hypothetical protein
MLMLTVNIAVIRVEYLLTALLIGQRDVCKGRGCFKLAPGVIQMVSETATSVSFHERLSPFSKMVESSLVIED